ncbi:polycystin-1-like protein 1 isoform X2 [Lineus longissimus]|uniref:polycystin-1-like protein 1 isoform X2 n=1 Tax=Lineus longissimus TaxID=88925 RepID=UPI002B4E0CEF
MGYPSYHYGIMKTNMLYGLLLILIVNHVAAANSNSSWYEGCYVSDNASAQVLSFRPPGVDLAKLSPAKCSQHCRNANYQYAGVQSNTCMCANSTSRLVSTATNQRCNNSCQNGDEMPCGDADAIAVYSAHGPYLFDVVIEVDHTLVVGSKNQIEVIATYAGAPENVSAGWPVSDPAIAVVTWSIDGATVSQQTTTAIGSLVKSVIEYDFKTEGEHLISVIVSNKISTLMFAANYTAILPRPIGLQVTLLNDSKISPTCIPRKYLPLAAKNVAVFLDQFVAFEFSLTIGLNVSFSLEFGDTGSRHVIEPYKETPPCSGRECITAVQGHTFKATGRYRLNITVENVYGKLEDTMDVVVVDHSLSNLTVRLDPSTALVTKVNVATKFFVTVVTASRMTSYLRLNFAHGAEKWYYLWDEDGDMIGAPPSGGEYIRLMASYDSSCMLSVEVDHVFTEEGVYAVGAECYNNHSLTVQSSSETVTVLRELLGPSLVLNSVVESNREINITATLVSESVNMTFSWGITNADRTFQKNFTTSDALLTHKFLKTGVYTVHLVVSNLHGSVATSGIINVHDLITDLSVSSSQEFIRMNHPVNCSATVATGSGIEFTWTWDDRTNPDQISVSGKTKEISHIFTQVGQYNVSVKAENLLNYKREYVVIIVQEAVTHLMLSSLGPVALGKASTIIARATTGTDVKFDVDFGSGRKAANGTEHGDNLHLKHVFAESGTYSVTVYAYNKVSDVKQTIVAMVEVPVEDVTILTTNPPVVNETSIIVVKMKDSISTRADILYWWRFLDQTIVTKTPMIKYKFASAGNIEMNVTVRNLVSSSSAVSVLNVVNTSPVTRLLHYAGYEYGKNTFFTLVNIPPSATIDVKYGDQSKPENFTVNTTSHKWKHTYNLLGLHQLVIRVMKGTSVVSIFSVVSIQERITALSVSGPPAVPLLSLTRGQKWKASLGSGSEVVFKWTFDKTVSYTAHNEIYQKFTQASLHNISVEVSNSISKMGAATTVIVQHPVSSVDILVSPVIEGQKSQLEILITGGREFVIDINFGDGTQTKYSSSDPGLGLVTLRESVDYSVVPLYKAELAYTYGRIGNYRIKVNVSNHLNWIEETSNALVDAPIEGVVLLTDAKQYIETDTVVAFNVTVVSGNNLTFTWQFGDDLPSTIENFDKYSLAAHQFSLPGTYNITVAIKNPLYTNPVVVALPFLVKVLIPIRQVFVAQLNGKTAAAFNPNTGLSSGVVFLATARYGSDVLFHFDFGDGTVSTVTTEIVFPKTSRGKASHAFASEGAFQVKVTASNALGNLTVALSSLFWVQIPPGDIGLPKKDEGPYAVMVFVNQTFTLITNGGTNVTYDWNLGDGTTKTDHGSVLTYMYTKTGNFNFQVKGYNKAGEKNFVTTMMVQQAIQACTLTASKTKLLTSPDTVTFTATPSSPADYFKWDFGNDQISDSFKNEMQQEYKSPGSYVVKVNATNYVGSNVVSNMLVIRVFAPVTNLKIQVLGSLLLNRPIKFDAQYYSGTNLTFTWDFGDGKGVVNKTGSSEIENTFQRKAEYNVTLIASNDVSRQSVHMTIFVLDQICHKPEIVFLGTNGVATYFQYARSDEIRIEIDTLVNCTTTSLTIYRWRIFKHGTRTLADLQDVHADLLKKKMLLLSPRALGYGNYTAQIEVRMGNGSIVHDEKQIDIFVQPTPLRPIISGGIIRNISMMNDLTFDGSQSYDPDFPDATDLSYNWTCRELNDDRAPCFKNNSNVLPSTARVVSLHGSAFIRAKEYVINLTISRPGRESRHTTQVLRVSTFNMLTVWVKCPKCLDGPVNSNYRVEITAGCALCDDEEATILYKWDLYLLSKVNDMTYAGAHDVGSCVEADGSSYIQYWKLISTTVAPNTTNTTTAAPTSASGNPTTPVGQTTSGASDGGTGGGSSVTQPPSGGGGVPPIFPNVGEGSTGGRGTRKRRNTQDVHVRRRRQSANPFQNIGEGSSGGSSSSSSSSSFPIGGGGISEGSTSGRGDGQGTGSGSTGGNTGTGGTTGGNGNNNEGDRVVDPFKPGINPHIVSQERYRIRLLAENTTTGLDHSSIVFRPGFLKQGRTYMAKVNVTYSKGAKRETGEAEWWFEVNESPNRGQCTFQPRSGVEEETNFRIFCHEWQDRAEDKPFIYKFTYRFPGSDVRYMIYGGQKTDFQFNLPAGQASQNYQVLVEIAIVDRRGAQTSVCQLPITVKPKDLTALKASGKSEEEILFDQYNSRDAIKIQEAIDKKDSKYFHNKVQLFVHQLNRAPRISTQRRQNVKNELFDSLKKLSIRDEYEALQTGSTVLRLTDTPEDMDRESLVDATDILAEYTNTVETLPTEDHQLSKDLLTFAVESSSNIIKAASMMPKESKNLEAMKYAIEKNEHSMHELLNACTKDHTEYEEAIQRHSTLVNVKAQGVKGNRLLMNVDEAEFAWDMKRLPKRRLRRDTSPATQLIVGECYLAHMILFNQDPYVFSAVQSHKVMAVASLNLYYCNGTHVPVRNLPADQLIHISIPRKTAAQNSFPQYTLNKENMNLHKFNFTRGNLNQSFHIIIQFEPVSPELRKFPLAVLINHRTMPTLEKYMEHKRYSADMDKIEMRIPAGRFNAPGDYYLGLVDANYNKGRPRDHVAQQRNYTIKMWWEACVFWDSAKSDWSPEGCSLKQTSTYEMQHCACNHLTSFGTHFSLTPNDLSFVGVDSFFDLHQNPVMIAFVIAVLLIYALAFAICYRYDAHDLKKGAVVYLQDNTATDRQRYEIIVETGFRKGAGTTSKVSLVLHGEEGMSETRELVNENNQTLFERNSRDIFVMTLPDNIGPIWKVQFWHNNSGVSPSWYLSRVIVRDINLDYSYYFQCEKWFAVEEEDGKVEQEFMTLEGGLGFRKIVWIKGTEYFTDYHLWGSLFTRPSYSRFFRTDRLTCCLSLLMSYMCLNAMWYQTNETEYRGEFGLIDVSWRAVVVGILTTVIVVPVNLALVMMFRKTKLRKPKSSTDKKYRSVNKDNHSTDGSTGSDNFDRSVQPVMTQSLLDQSILNWQSLQEWAQKQWTKRYQQSVTSSAENVKPESTPQVQEVREPTPTQNQKGCETDQTSSGFEDYSSQQVQTPLPQVPEVRKKSEENSVSSAGIELIANDAESKRASPCLLPWGCRYILLIVTWLIIAGCAAVTILYGFRFGRTKSIQWLQSLFFSFMMCMFITHPIVILVITIYSAIKYRNTPAVLDHLDDDRDTEVREKQRPFNRLDYYEDCDDLEKGIAARQRSRYLRFARPPQEKQLIESRKKTMKEKKAVTIFWETVKYLVVLTVALFVAFGKDTSTPYHLNKAVTVQFTESLPNPFQNIRSVSDWWRWSQSDLLDRLYWERWYNGQETNTDRNYILDGSSTIVGYVNLRQMRVDNKSCDIPYPYNVTDTCYYGYGSWDASTASFGPGEKWSYSPWSDLYRYKIYGRLAEYDGAGFLVKLNSTRAGAYAQLQKLKAQEWIDRHTRAIIVEFTLYNAPTNLFTSVSLVCETPPTGGAFPLVRVDSAYMYRYFSAFDHVVLAFELIFISIIMFKIQSFIGGAIREKKRYFRNLWNVLHLVQLVFCVTYIVCYILRFVYVHDTIERLRATFLEEYVDVFFIALWDELLRTLVGSIVFIIFVQFLRLLRYRKLFARLGNVYWRARREILIFTALFIVILMAWTSLGVALFRTVSWSFSEFHLGFMSLSSLLVMKYRFQDIEEYSLHGARVFVCVFFIFGMGILLSYIVAVLSLHFRVGRHDQVLTMSSKELMNFYWNRLLVWLKVRRITQDDDDDSVLPPEFTMAEIEYQVDELLFKMNAISGSHGLPEKPPCYYTDSDCTYGIGDDGVSSGGSEVRGFDETRFESRIAKIEDNLYMQEPHLAQLIQLDNIGTNILSQEREKQLRSELELEIFRQLQVQRQEGKSQSNTHFDGSTSSPLRAGDGLNQSGNNSPHFGLVTSQRKPAKFIFPKPPVLGKLKYHDPFSEDFGAHRRSRRCDHRGSFSDTDVYDIPVHGGKSDDYGSCEVVSMDDETVNRPGQGRVHGRLSPGVDRMSHRDSNYSHSILDLPPGGDLLDIPIHRLDDDYPRPRTSVEKSRPFDCLYDSSSSSEYNLARSRSAKADAKPRSLRKTKSRGKGKGRKEFTPIKGLDELGIENGGYSSDSDVNVRVSGRQKQCWS